MFFKSKAPEKDRNAANTAEVIETMVQQQHSVVEQVAASPPVPALRAGEIKEVEMLNTTKSGVPEKDKNAAANAAEVMGRAVQPHDQAWGRSESTKAGTASCIGSDMSIVGKIECEGPAQVFGRIEGELRASDLLISDGAHIEGSVIAQNVTVCGRVKGTIRAVRVKLQNGGARSRVIFFIGRYRSMRTLSLKDRRGGLKIQRIHLQVLTPKARRKKTWPPPRHRPSTPSWRMGRSTRLRTDFATQPDVAASWTKSRRRAGAPQKQRGVDYRARLLQTGPATLKAGQPRPSLLSQLDQLATGFVRLEPCRPDNDVDWCLAPAVAESIGDVVR